MRFVSMFFELLRVAVRYIKLGTRSSVLLKAEDRRVLAKSFRGESAPGEHANYVLLERRPYCGKVLLGIPRRIIPQFTLLLRI